MKWQDHHWSSKVGLWGSSLPAWLSNTCYELRTSVQWATIVQYDGGTAKPGGYVGCILPQTTEKIPQCQSRLTTHFLFSLGSILFFSRPQIHRLDHRLVHAQRQQQSCWAQWKPLGNKMTRSSLVVEGGSLRKFSARVIIQYLVTDWGHLSSERQ